MAEPEWPGETKREEDKNEKTEIDKNFWGESENQTEQIAVLQPDRQQSEDVPKELKVASSNSNNHSENSQSN